MDERVSVIIPVYNGERFLAEAIQSVLAQTMPPDEIIVVDDGSTDGTAAIVAGFAARTSLSIRYIYQENQGTGSARNCGLELVTGDLVAFLDADDLWLPEKTACQSNIFYNNLHAGVAWGNAISFRDGIHLDSTSEYNRNPPTKMLLLQSMLLRRAVIHQVGAFDPNLRMGEDVDWLLRAIESGIQIVAHQDLVVYYRRHAMNLTNDVDRTRLAFLNTLRLLLARRRQKGLEALSSPPICLPAEDTVSSDLALQSG